MARTRLPHHPSALSEFELQTINPIAREPRKMVRLHRRLARSLRREKLRHLGFELWSSHSDSDPLDGGADDFLNNVVREIKIRPDRPELHATDSSSQCFGQTRIEGRSGLEADRVRRLL